MTDHHTETDTHMRVDIIGAEQRTLNAFQTAFSGPGKNYFSIVNATVAEALIVDLDGQGADDMWREYRLMFPHRPTLVIASKKVDLDASIPVLYKPLNIHELLGKLSEIQKTLYSDESHEISNTRPGKSYLIEAMLDHTPTGTGNTDRHIKCSEPMSGYEKRLSESMEMAPDESNMESLSGNYESTQLIPSKNAQEIETQLIVTGNNATEPESTLLEFSENILPMDRLAIMGNKEDRSIADLEKDSHLFLHVNNHLLGIFQAILKAAVKNRISACLTVADNKILILPDKDEIWLEKGENPLHLFCHKPIERRYAHVSVHDVLPDAHENYQVESMTSFLWKMAIWTYRGRLPPGTDMNSRIYLAHWPNFTRLMPIPNAMRVATLWTEQSMPLTFTAEALGIPQRNVFAIYSASYTIGLSGQARRQSDRLFQPGALVRGTT